MKRGEQLVYTLVQYKIYVNPSRFWPGAHVHHSACLCQRPCTLPFFLSSPINTTARRHLKPKHALACLVADPVFRICRSQSKRVVLGYSFDKGRLPVVPKLVGILQFGCPDRWFGFKKRCMLSASGPQTPKTCSCATH